MRVKEILMPFYALKSHHPAPVAYTLSKLGCLMHFYRYKTGKQQCAFCRHVKTIKLLEPWRRCKWRNKHVWRSLSAGYFTNKCLCFFLDVFKLMNLRIEKNKWLTYFNNFLKLKRQLLTRDNDPVVKLNSF